MIILIVAAAWIGCGAKDVPEGTVVTVLYTNDVRGKLEGCGCRHNGGGITKRSAEVAAARSEDPSVVYCDAGNFLTGTPEVDSTKGFLSIEVYNHLRATVVNVSERELAFGTDAFKEAKRRADFAFVSANLRHRGGAIADPYVIRRVKEARVAFVGLCGTKNIMRYDSLKLPEEVTIEEPLVAARRVVSELEGKAHLIVVLSTCGDAMDSALARAIPQINLIVGGRSFRNNADAPWDVGGTRIVRTMRDGRTIGRMDMVFGAIPPFKVGDKMKLEEGMFRGMMAEVRRMTQEKGVVKATMYLPDRGIEIALDYPLLRGIKTFHSTEISMEATGRSDPEMLALVRERVPGFVDNPTDGVRVVRQ
ncbi:hypothetical protein KJ815_02960 [bacterium]|nr:hypothetical protein [bacterium]